MKYYLILIQVATTDKYIKLIPGIGQNELGKIRYHFLNPLQHKV